VRERLVQAEASMILLLTPPFQESKPNPGYIQGYLAGIRENGGQYTHAALWVVLAHALKGDGNAAHELFQMLNPLNHARTPEEVERYKVEPYVIAADVYSHPQHHGRGGWTWYTGSASWMYQIAVEHLLGLKLRGKHFTVQPCIPQAWPGYEIAYSTGTTQFEIAVENPEGVSTGVRSVELDGEQLEGDMIPLLDDGKTHRVRVVLGNKE
jgi:cyclic beta-1,2-glucan synthetase